MGGGMSAHHACSIAVHDRGAFPPLRGGDGMPAGAAAAMVWVVPGCLCCACWGCGGLCFAWRATGPRYCTPKLALRCSNTTHCIAAAGTILHRFGTRPCTAGNANQ